MAQFEAGGLKNKLDGFLRPLHDLREVLEQSDIAEQQYKAFVQQRAKEETELKKFKERSDGEKANLDLKIKHAQESLDRINQKSKTDLQEIREERGKVIDGLEKTILDLKNELAETQARGTVAEAKRQKGANEALQKAKDEFGQVEREKIAASNELRLIKGKIEKTRQDIARVETI